MIDKKVEQGDYVSQGGALFDLADLSSVWAIFDAYESDLPYLKTGDRFGLAVSTRTLAVRAVLSSIGSMKEILPEKVLPYHSAL